MYNHDFEKITHNYSCGVSCGFSCWQIAQQLDTPGTGGMRYIDRLTKACDNIRGHVERLAEIG